MHDDGERNKNNKEDLDRVFNAYNASSGSFQKVFGILIGAGVAVAVIVGGVFVLPQLQGVPQQQQQQQQNPLLL